MKVNQSATEENEKINAGLKISSDATRHSSLAGAGEDVRRTGEGRRVKINLCVCVTPVRNVGGNQ